MSKVAVVWEPNGKNGQEKLLVNNGEGQSIQMALVHLSNHADPGKGYTLVKRDLNMTGNPERFFPQHESKKEWGLTLDSAKDRAEFFTHQTLEMAHQLTGGRSHSREMDHAEVGGNGRMSDPEEFDHTHDR